MKQTAEIKQLKQEIKRLKQELVIAQTINRMHGDSRPIMAALQTGIKPEDLPEPVLSTQ